MAKRQATLVTIWSKDNSVKRRRQDSATVECAGVVEDAAEDFPTEATEVQAECDPRAEVSSGTDSGGSGDDFSCEEADLADELEMIDDTPYEEASHGESIPVCSPSATTEAESVAPVCSGQCCSNEEIAFQPKDKPTLMTLAAKKRNFQPQWYKQYPWLSVCTTQKKVFCLYRRNATKHKLIAFSKTGDKAFTESGFGNWKKALEKFKSHENSDSHREAKLKWVARGHTTIAGHLNAQMDQLQKERRDGLLAQLAGLRFLTRQGIAIRGHTESEGNLQQRLLMQSSSNEVVKKWLKANCFACSHMMQLQSRSVF